MDNAKYQNELDTPYVEAELIYLLDTGEKPVNYPSVAGGRAERDTGPAAHRTVIVRNARLSGEPFTLDLHGFTLARHETAVRDFYDDAELHTTYEAEVTALIREQTRAERVVVFDHTRRSDDARLRDTRTIRGPAATVHNDYTERSAIRRLRDILPDEADELLKRRFAIVNAWRSIAGPVYTSPVALCDGRSVAPADMIVTERRGVDRIGETYRIAYNAAHRWFYYPQLERDEAVLIKTHDSSGDGRCRFAPHAAFRNPAAPSGAPPRESVESRAFAFFSAVDQVQPA